MRLSTQMTEYLLSSKLQTLPLSLPLGTGCGRKVLRPTCPLIPCEVPENEVSCSILTRDRAWLCSNKDIAQMWNLDTLDTRSKLQAIARHLQLVCDIYSDDPGRRRVVVDQLGAVPSGAARNQAQRIERLAMRQYGLLGAADPLRRCAAEWMDILRNGDLLRNPDPGTAAAQVNRRLAARTAGIDAAVSAHDLAVRQSHPDTRAQRQIAGQALVNQPPPAGKSLCKTGCLSLFVDRRL